MGSMSDDPSLDILCTSAPVAAILRQELEKQRDFPSVIIHEDPLNRDSYALILGEDMPYPLRLGALWDHLSRLLENSAAPALEIGPYRLDIHRLEWTKNGQDMIRLTEKEAELIKILYDAKGALVDRDRLLREVWEYAPDVESHTIETHIYRLRQKIEDNPASPSILLTGEEGYNLNPDLMGAE